MRHKKRLALCTVAAAAAAAVIPLSSLSNAQAAEEYEGLPAGTLKAKSLVIGVDGTTFDKLADAETPRIDRLMSQGMTARSNLYAEPMSTTFSGPGWSTIGHGVWPDKHKVTGNDFGGADFAAYPDYLTRLERANPDASTFAAGTWDEITTQIFSDSVDKKVDGDDAKDADTTQQAADQLANGDPDSSFVQLDEVDHAGHEHGADSQEYRDALKSADGNVGKLIDAVTSRPSYGEENWQIIVTTDHGHTDAGGHGGNSPQERGTFVIAKGDGFTPGSERHDVKLTDVAPTVLAHEGVAADPAWRLDGKPVSALKPDAFDAQRGALQGPVDETSLPKDVKGWTTTPPDGWTIDNSKMPAGGVTEWRGWSFATDEFWSNADLGQGRETNVRARDVFAVADSDEWADAAGTAGTFDSTLISPEFDLDGSTSATLSFAGTFMVDGPQSGEVLVSYDGREPQSVKTYADDSNGVEKISLNVPEGATNVQVRFRYTGDNSSFWSVDQVVVSQ